MGAEHVHCIYKTETRQETSTHQTVSLVVSSGNALYMYQLAQETPKETLKPPEIIFEPLALNSFGLREGLLQP